MRLGALRHPDTTNRADGNIRIVISAANVSD
jgi:hypothetical protein